MLKKVCLVALGCPKNIVEVESMAGLLKNSGWELTTDLSSSQAAIVHTCSFIKDARDESTGVIKALSDIRKKGKLEKLIVSGCLVQGEGKTLIDEFQEVDGFIGTGNLQNILKLLNGEKNFILSKPGGLLESAFPRLLSSELPYAYIRIAEGCSHRCSFCTIPSLRGNYKSRSIASIVSEAVELEQNGIKELILIAQDSTYFGFDRYGKYLLSDLLKELVKIEGFKWIRIMYSYPGSLNGRLIDVINSEHKICKYLDLPLQHISNNVLRKMRRPLNVKDLVKRLKSSIPGLSLRTTLITGFPGETQSDFKEMFDFVSEGWFDQLGVFEYSDNKNIPSHGHSGHITDKIKNQRRNQLMLLQKTVVAKKNRNWKNKSVKVLVEGMTGNGKCMYGRAYFQAPEIDSKIYFNPAAEIGSFQEVIITGYKGYDLSGVLSKNESGE